MSDFLRNKQTERFAFGGMKTNSSPDSMPPGKYPFARNIRAYTDNSIRTRPGQTQRATGAHTVTDIRAYTVLGTDDLPRILNRDANDQIRLDNIGTQGTLAGGGVSPGAAMIPFRPNQSPNPYMYIANGFDYQKFSAPVANVSTPSKVGIAEPQTAPDAMLFGFSQGVFWSNVLHPAWVAGGTAGATATGNRLSDTCGVVLPDPSPFNSGGYMNSIQVGAAVKYQKLMPIELRNNVTVVVQDVFPPLVTAIAISAIYYFTGSTGRCIIVPSNTGLQSSEGVADSIYLQNSLASLRRGSLIKIASEIVYVWSITIGPDGTIAIETSTTGAHTTADTITGVPAIQTLGGSPVAGNSITALDETYAVTAGVGTETTPAAFVSNAFIGPFGRPFQADDYITLGIFVDNLPNLNEVKFLIDVGDGTFTQDFYYYTIRPSDITSAVANNATQLANLQTVTQRALIDTERGIGFNNQIQTSAAAQLYPGSSQWTQIVFPISQLTRVGNDQTKSLQNINKVQFLWNAAATINVATSEPLVFAGHSPDVGDIGAPYRYRVRARSSVTGVRSNPSPATRYGVSPRRTSIAVTLPSAAYDSQIDTWDIFRYGGSVTSWRFIGQTASTNTSFEDNYSDAAAQAGEALDFDNFEPWPSIDVPFNGTLTTLTGTVAVVSTTNPNITRYLPGTLIRIASQNASSGANVYTLRTRPTLISSTNYLLQFLESANTGASLLFQIPEPILARQFLPYMWGPDAGGTIFACGDPLRAGTLYFAKNNNPDSAPDSYNIEITPPSEPLLGGEEIDGLAFVASSNRWWALYPQPDNPTQRYAVVKQPFIRGLAAPYAHCNDGRSIYWVAEDGVYSSLQGSLTDADLYNLFPHDAVKGETITYLTATLTPPDYSRAGTFRLAFNNGYLYFSYQDSSGAYVNLVCYLATMAWSVDAYAIPVSVFYSLEQQAGTVLTNTTLYDDLLMGNTGGQIATASDLADDINAGGASVFGIPCVLGTHEDSGGDVRAPKQWGDLFLDATPAATGGIVPSLVALKTLVATLPAVPTAAIRTRQPLSVSSVGPVISEFLGIQLTWTDDFTSQSVPTILYIWEPSFVVQPARDIEWFTFGTSFGLQGYMHIREIAVAWVSTAPITLTVTSYDGQSPAPIVIPSSGGAYKKVLFELTANKGQLYKFHAVSAQQFQFFLSDFEVRVGQWGRSGPYLMEKTFQADTSPLAVI